MISWKVGGGAFVMLESLKFEWFAEGDRKIRFYGVWKTNGTSDGRLLRNPRFPIRIHQQAWLERRIAPLPSEKRTRPEAQLAPKRRGIFSHKCRALRRRLAPPNKKRGHQRQPQPN